MKRVIVLGLILITLAIASGLAYATATNENGSTRAVPVSVYGTTSGGDLKPILTDADGVVQTA
jgi:hypothetical protein